MAKSFPVPLIDACLDCQVQISVCFWTPGTPYITLQVTAKTSKKQQHLAWFIETNIQSNIDISNSDISNSAKLEASI